MITASAPGTLFITGNAPVHDHGITAPTVVNAAKMESCAQKRRYALFTQEVTPKGRWEL